MRQFPLFVPSSEGHVAAVVTTPDGGDPAGVVLVLAGTGRHHVIGSTLGALLATRLAAHRLATVRLDYEGSGDSPGVVASWTPSDVGAAVAQVKAVLGEACGSLGVRSFASVGTCYGSRIALDLTAESACVGAVCLAPPLFVRRTSQVSGRPRRDAVLALLHANALSRRLVIGPLRKLAARRMTLAAGGVGLDHLDHARVAFLYGRNPQADHYSAAVQQRIDSAVAELPADRRARFGQSMLEQGPLTTFDGLAHGDQEAILDAVVPLVVECFAAPVNGSS
jgi:dienelactone hydrolase